MLEFLKKEKINYVFYSEEERGLGNFNPEKYNFLKEVYSFASDTISANSCMNNNTLSEITKKQSSDCMSAGVYQNETVKIYKFIDDNQQ